MPERRRPPDYPPRLRDSDHQRMSDRCTECGAVLLTESGCQRHFHDLLALEWEIPGGPGELAHFYAVATYGLQHPVAMNFTVETLNGLRDAVSDALAGNATLEDLRKRVRASSTVAGRVTRREGDRAVRWKVETWPMTITDVLTVRADREDYLDRVSRWAASVLRVLDKSGP